MNDQQRLRAIIKRDKEIAKMMFNNPIIRSDMRTRDVPYVYDSNNKRITPLKVGRSRPKVGKMLGEVK